MRQGVRASDEGSWTGYFDVEDKHKWTFAVARGVDCNLNETGGSSRAKPMAFEIDRQTEARIVVEAVREESVCA